MKRIFCAVILACVMCTGAFAVSEDMSAYVRQDVFDAKMEMLFMRLHSEIENLGTRLEGKIDALSVRIDGLDRSLTERINGLEKRIDGLNNRIDDTHTFVYWILVLFGAIFLMPFVSRFWELHIERRPPAVTLDDVKRLIAEAMTENSAKIKG